MIQQQSLSSSAGRTREVRMHQFVGRVTDLIVPDEAAAAPRPQAFLVEQSPRWTLPTHFHLEHQFQVFVGGSGTLGRSPLPHLAVHYASPHSGYGPLVSGDDGLSYLTLRAVGDTGAWYLPEQREHLLLRVPKRQAHGAPSAAMPLQAIAALGGPVVETLIAPEAGGMAAWMVRLPPGATVAPAHGPGGGRFVVVHQGSLEAPQGELTALGVVWMGADDALPLRAGAHGLEAVVLQFPVEAAHSFVEQGAAAAMRNSSR